MTRVLVLVLALAASLAHAASPDDEARARAFSSTGVRQYNEGLYDDAIASFEAAYKLVPLPLLIFDIAQSYRLKGEAYCAEALDHYRAFLRAASPRDPNRALAEEYVEQASACVRRRAAPTAEPRRASVAVAPPPIGAPQPTAAPIVTQPATHTSPSRIALRATGLASLGLGVALVGAGAYFGSAAASARDTIEDTCRGGCTWTDELAASERTRASGVVKAAALLGVGIAACAAGSVLTYYGWRPGPRGR